jgi:predicted nucleic acid-binding protein
MLMTSTPVRSSGRPPSGSSNSGSTVREVLSTQVLPEFYVNVTQKIPAPFSKSAAREVVRNYAGWVHVPLTPATVIRASEISEVWRLSFWDGMIVAAAEQEGAEILLTEDLNAGQRIAGMQVVDPFLS